jgi:hypothetical protein
MQTWRRTLAALLGAVAIIAAVVPPGWAKGSRTTSTTAPPAPGQGPVPPGAVVNSWALAPGSTDPRQPGDRADFSYSVAPGGSVTDAITVFNFSNVELTFHVYATDAFNQNSGQLDLLPPDKKPADVGTWVVLPQDNLTLLPHQQATFPFTLRIPPGARPGDHVGAILAANDALGTGPNGKMVKIDRRTGSRLYVRVAGALAPDLAIRKISSAYHPRLNSLSGPVDVTYRVENRGNVRMAGRAWVTASGLLGLGSKRSHPLALPELLPGQSMQLKVHFNGIPATVLAFSRAHVKPSAVGATSSLQPVSLGSRSLAVPLTVVALGLIIALVLYARRSYKRHNDGPPGAERQLQ